MALSNTELRDLTKQLLGGRSSTQLSNAWYDARVMEGYRALTTFQGEVKYPDNKRRFRILRFFELFNDYDRTLNVAAGRFIDATDNGGATRAAFVYELYDKTNKRPIKRISRHAMARRDITLDGTPREWCPIGQGDALGYFLYPFSQTAQYDITAREYIYQYPESLTTQTTPVIPEEWHPAIAIFAAELGAIILDIPERRAELRDMKLEFIAERKTPYEESAFSGRRHAIQFRG